MIASCAQARKHSFQSAIADPETRVQRLISSSTKTGLITRFRFNDTPLTDTKGRARSLSTISLSITAALDKATAKIQITRYRSEANASIATCQPRGYASRKLFPHPLFPLVPAYLRANNHITPGNTSRGRRRDVRSYRLYSRRYQRQLNRILILCVARGRSS